MRLVESILLILAVHLNLYPIKGDTPSRERLKASSVGVTVDQPTFDFGQIMVDADLHHVFRLTNKGAAEVSIKSARSIEEYVTIERFPSSVAPGKSEELVVTISSDRAPLSFDAGILVEFGDSRTIPLSLRVMGQRFPSVRVEPTSVSFGEFRIGEVDTRVVRIINSGSRSMHVLPSAISSTGRFAARIDELVPGKEFEVLVYPTGKGPPEVVVDDVVVETDLPRYPRIVINVSATIMPALEVIPTSIIIPTVASPNQGTSRYAVRLLNHGHQPVHVRGAKCDRPQVEVLYHEIEVGRLFQFTVEIPPGQLVGSFEANLVITTDDVNQPEIKLPITKGQEIKKAAGPIPKAARRPAAMDFEGLAAPEFQLSTTVPGVEISTKEIANWPATILNFVAPNCGFCKRQLPQVESARKEFEQYGIRFVNVSQTMQKEFSAEEAVGQYSANGSELEVAIDPGNRTGQRFKATSYPTLFVIGPDGMVRQVIVGAKPNMKELLEQALWPIIDGKHTPAVPPR